MVCLFVFAFRMKNSYLMGFYWMDRKGGHREIGRPIITRTLRFRKWTVMWTSVIYLSDLIPEEWPTKRQTYKLVPSRSIVDSSCVNHRRWSDRSFCLFHFASLHRVSISLSHSIHLIFLHNFYFLNNRWQFLTNVSIINKDVIKENKTMRVAHRTFLVVRRRCGILCVCDSVKLCVRLSVRFRMLCLLRCYSG